MELRGTRVAILAEDPYAAPEPRHPLCRLREAGAEVVGTGSGAAGAR